MRKKDAAAFFNKIEERGRDAARQETRADAWTQNLAADLSNLPPISVRVSPVVNMVETPQMLLKQALGQVKAENGAPKTLKEGFATVASLPPAYARFLYPEGKKAEDKKSQPTAKKPKGPTF